MCAVQNSHIQDVDSMVELVDEIFANINIGLLIYLLEDSDDEASLKLIYANNEAAHYTDADLRSRVGQYIYNAFPTLQETDLAATYTEVIKLQEARKIGVVEYRDPLMNEGAYAVRAFPMPLQCVGIIFEDFSLRKQVHEILKKQVDDLEKQNADLIKILMNTNDDIRKLLDELEQVTRQSDLAGQKTGDKILGNSAAIRTLINQIRDKFSEN